jgi:short-subunit dehydrogenase
MRRRIEDAVVVITGASSGIGRATALEFARHNARLVLAARNESNLEKTAQLCQKAGAREVLLVPTDTTEEDEVQKLASQAAEQFGRIDVWINNAGVGLYGSFEDTPIEDYRRLLETNLFGYIYGARAVLPYFREQGTGVLINVGSQVSLGGLPYNNAYTTSKYAVRGFADSLRQELVDTDIHVCTVYPASTDTPFFQHAANYSGRQVQPLGSVDKPEKVARIIRETAENPKPEVLVSPRAGTGMAFLHWVAPEAYDRLLSRKTKGGHFKSKKARDSEGNLYDSSDYASVHGGWSGSGGGKAAGIAVVGGVAAVVIYLLKQQREAADGEKKSAA